MEMYSGRSLSLFLASYPVAYWYGGLFILLFFGSVGWFLSVHSFIEKAYAQYEKKIIDIQNNERTINLLQKELQLVAAQNNDQKSEKTKRPADGIYEYTTQLLDLIQQIDITVISVKKTVMPLNNLHEKHMLHLMVSGTAKQMALFFDTVKQDGYAFNLDGIEMSMERNDRWILQFDCWIMAAKKDKKSLQLKNKLKG